MFSRNVIGESQILARVVRFVMEDLDDLARASAFIETDVAPRDYSIDAIEKIYAKIKGG